MQAVRHNEDTAVVICMLTWGWSFDLGFLTSKVYIFISIGNSHLDVDLSFCLPVPLLILLLAQLNLFHVLSPRLDITSFLRIYPLLLKRRDTWFLGTEILCARSLSLCPVQAVSIIWFVFQLMVSSLRARLHFIHFYIPIFDT